MMSIKTVIIKKKRLEIQKIKKRCGKILSKRPQEKMLFLYFSLFLKILIELQRTHLKEQHFHCSFNVVGNWTMTSYFWWLAVWKTNNSICFILVLFSLPDVCEYCKRTMKNLEFEICFFSANICNKRKE